MVKTSQKKRVHKKQANCFSVYVNRDQRRGKECCCVFFSTSCCENSIEVHIPTTAPRKRAAQHGNYQKGLMTMVLDVLTPLSDCRQESVEKMERRISGVSYMCWIDFHNGILGCGFFCARLISVCVSFSGSLSQRGLPRPTALFSGYHAEGYHARTDAFKLTGYHVCRVTTPELPRSK